MNRVRLLLAALCATGSICQVTWSQENPDFNRDVRPLLSDRCLTCHGPDENHREADLRLDSEASATALRDGYQIIAPGDPAASELIKRITTDDPDLRMPPPDSGKELSKQEIETLRAWVAGGAKFDQHWAYSRPQKHDVPATRDRSWPRTDIDRFILSGLEARGLTPSADADPVTLIRRVYLDLTGLPPSPPDVAAFVADPTRARFESIVDSLLASDAHAEQLAIYWLDLVRYADTVGYHGDQDHNISPYRDWVIDAFAQNMPFDEFTRDQLAGDLVPDATIDQRIASGYNRLLQTSHEGGVQPKEYLAIYAADRVRNVSAVWMGATVGCAQCHDHKYDPYTARDFYSLSAFFADLDEDQHFRVGNNSLPTKRPPEIAVLTRRERARIETLKGLLKNEDVTEATGQDVRERIRRIEAAKRVTMISVSKEPRITRILPRGNWLDDSGPVVSPEVPAFLGAIQVQGRGTRLDLARWLTEPDDGAGLLTARVFANRFWYLLFGSGLSRSLDDFGGQGFAPDHPELLDRLAVDFVESGWNVRQLLKQIVMSRTYQQSSAWKDALAATDPDNRLFARQSSYRLSAETVRDSVLAISGLLNRSVGGPSVKPPQPAGYYRHLNFPTRKYKADTDDRQWRRGLYVHWQRQFLHPMLRAFDAPTREECTAERPRSNTPLAALTMLNEPSFVAAARKLAARMRMAGPDSATRIRYGMQLATCREPDAREQAILLELYRASVESFRASPDSARQLANDVPNPVEAAAWISVARAILNLDEVIVRS